MRADTCLLAAFAQRQVADQRGVTRHDAKEAQAIRAGNVLVANAPGSAFLESPALLGFLPALSRQLTGEELSLPALPTWWCGEHSAMEDALTRLPDCTIRPTYPGSAHHQNFDAVSGARLDARGLDEWVGRIVRHPEEHTVQASIPLSEIPTWQVNASGSKEQSLQARPVMLRVFAISDGAQGWRVLPGGMARVASAGQEITSMQRGDSSADVWALTNDSIDHTTLLQPHLTPDHVLQRKRMVTSRAAENLFWLGRYTERTENNLRLFLTLLYQAREQIIITSPYFVPDESMLYAITSATQRGVHVELFVSAIGDQALVYHAQRSYYEALLEAGVVIWLYKAPTILHSKHFSIDDDVAVIGSSNMDMRSFSLNKEISLLVRGKSFVSQMRDVEEQYRKQSRQLTSVEWSKQPLRSTVLDGLARLTSALQ